MEPETVVTVLAIALSVIGIIWNQQRTTDKLRKDFNASHEKLRDELTASDKEMRKDFTRAHEKLRDELRASLIGLWRAVRRNGERLAAIEAMLGIGMHRQGYARGSDQQFASARLVHQPDADTSAVEAGVQTTD